MNWFRKVPWTSIANIIFDRFVNEPFFPNSSALLLTLLSLRSVWALALASADSPTSLGLLATRIRGLSLTTGPSTTVTSVAMISGEKLTYLSIARSSNLLPRQWRAFSGEKIISYGFAVATKFKTERFELIFGWRVLKASSLLLLLMLLLTFDENVKSHFSSEIFLSFYLFCSSHVMPLPLLLRFMTVEIQLMIRAKQLFSFYSGFFSIQRFAALPW